MLPARRRVPLFVAYNDDMQSGKKIVVVKENCGNAFVPYLTNNYKEVHVVDPGLWKGNLKSYMQDNNIDEVLFLNSVVTANSADYAAATLRPVFSSTASGEQNTQSTQNDQDDQNGGDQGEAYDGGDDGYYEEEAYYEEENYEGDQG